MGGNDIRNNNIMKNNMPNFNINTMKNMKYMKI